MKVAVIIQILFNNIKLWSIIALIYKMMKIWKVGIGYLLSPLFFFFTLTYIFMLI